MVRKAFQEKYPNISAVKWEKDGDDEWEGHFTMDGKKYSAAFSNDGSWLETECLVEPSEIPEKVSNTLEDEFSGWEIEGSELSETEEGTAYEFKLKSNDNEIEVVISMEGMVLERPDGSRDMTASGGTEMEFTSDFSWDECSFSTTGSNSFFILEPGYQLTLKGKEKGEEAELVITVLNETKMVNGIETRVVEERESVNGELEEVSRNYFAYCKESGNIYYYGEAVDMYEDGELKSHSGAWLAEGENRAGIIMLGSCFLGSRFYQEMAPGIAMDRAEIVSVSEEFETPAGKFSNVLKTQETTSLNASESEYKLYAPGIGLIKDENLLLVTYGFK